LDSLSSLLRDVLYVPPDYVTGFMMLHSLALDCKPSLSAVV
jgi:hypothetical protein